MKKTIFKSIAAITILTLSFAACKKDDKTIAPPVEQEIITTVKLSVTDSAGVEKVFVYKIENGFGNTTQGTIQIDTIKLAANTTYQAAVTLYNEKADPEEDITEEVNEENTEHLFLYASNPATGAGSITTGNGNTDNDGMPFNRIITLTTGATGTGALTINLMHEPTNKNGATPETSGGETDVEATYPVILQ